MKEALNSNSFHMVGVTSTLGHYSNLLALGADAVDIFTIRSFYLVRHSLSDVFVQPSLYILLH
jgi:hypothetical protein